MITNFYNIRFKTFTFFVALLFLSLSTQIFAQSGSIKGQVFDKESNNALMGANIMIDGSTLGTASDLDGNFILRNIPEGQQTIVISYLGYQPDTVSVNIVANRMFEEDYYLIPEALEGETVTVTAQAEGQLQAINQQLTSDNIANIVSEKKIQELPDYNAASALSRLPGVSTTQSSGEDNKVVIRGLSPKYNSIQVEGIQLSATGSSQIGLSSNPNSGGTLSNDRSVDLTMVSPYMLRMIAVYKTLTPDMNANSIGGTVNMQLREAPTDPQFEAVYQQGYTAKSNTFTNYRAVASGSARFFGEKLGVYALLNAESYDRSSDNLGANYDLAAEAVAIDPSTGFRPVKVEDVTFNRHLETRERYGGNLILDYNIPDGSFKFINMLARINSDYTEHRQTINYNQGRMNWQMRQGETVIDQQMHSLQFNYDFGLLSTDLSASYTASSNFLDKSPRVNFNQTDALQSGYIRDNIKPEDLTFLLTEFKGDSSVVLRSADLFSNDYQQDRLTYIANFSIPFNFGNSVSGFFKFGGQMYNQTNETDQETPYLSFNGNATSTDDNIQANLMRDIYNTFGIALNESGNLAGTSFLNTDEELYSQFLEDEFGDIYYVSDPELLRDIIDYITSKPEYDASNSAYSSGAQGGWYDGPYQQLTNDYKYTEDYYAAYAMAKVNWLDFMLIGGVRYEKVETEYFAYNARDQRNPQAQIMYDTTAYKGNEFTLPMGQIKYSPTNWMDIRYAYGQSLSRPDFSQLSPKFTITQDNTIYTGNPDLIPAKSVNHDLNFTFHSNEIGLVTVGGFYKTIENFVYSADYQLDAAEDGGIDQLSNYQIVRNGNLVVTPIVNPSTGKSNARVYRPLNNPNDAIVKGLELDFQHNFWYLPEPFNNLVFGINYTRIFSETEYPFFDVEVVIQPRPLPPLAVLTDSSATGRLIDQPNHVLNTYLGYDYKGFSARLSFLFQDNAARGNGGRYPENDSYTTEYFRVDFSARQMLPWWGLELFGEIRNINNSNTSWIQRSIEGFRGIENYGLVASLGLRFRYTSL